MTNHPIITWLQQHNLESDMLEFIKRHDAFTRLASGMNGWRWQDELLELCKTNRIPASEAKSKSLPYDCVVNFKRVQCKSTCYQERIDIRSKKASTNRRYSIFDFDVLALKLITDKGKSYYFVPSEALIDKSNYPYLSGSIQIADYRHYRDDWSVMSEPTNYKWLDYKLPTNIQLILNGEVHEHALHGVLAGAAGEGASAAA